MLIIRQYRQSDQPAVMKLHYDGVEQIEAEFSANNPQTGDADYEDPPFSDEDLDNIPANYLNPGGDFLVGEVDGCIVAMGGLQMKTDTCVMIRRMRTSPALQGQGYGRQILESLLDRAVELGYKEVIADPLKNNTGARRFYQSAGFIEAGEEKLGRYEITYYTMKLPGR